MFDFKKKFNKHNILFKNQILKTKKNKNFSVTNLSLTKKIVKELNAYGFSNANKIPLTSLYLSISDLSKAERKIMEKELVQNLEFDFTLYRDENKVELSKEMDKKLKKYIFNFERAFKIKFAILYKINDKQDKINSIYFMNYLNKLDNGKFMIFFKMAKSCKSSILVFNYFSNLLDTTNLINLCNIEVKFQQRKWGITKEQKLVDLNFSKIIGNYTIFFRYY